MSTNASADQRLMPWFRSCGIRLLPGSCAGARRTRWLQDRLRLLQRLRQEARREYRVERVPGRVCASVDETARKMKPVRAARLLIDAPPVGEA